MKTVAINGHFDPLHVGHIKFIQEARKRGKVVVILNNDSTTIKKRGYIFTPQEDRRVILENIKGVSRVVMVPENDNNALAVSKIFADIRCDIFQAGHGDSKELIPVCEQLGIQFVELEQRGRDSQGDVCSSSELVKRMMAGHDNNENTT